MPGNLDLGGSVGAYGLAIEGADGARRLLVPSPDGWPVLRIRRSVGPASDEPERFTPDRAELSVASGGRIALERDPPRAHYELPDELGDDALVHPYLVPVAAVMGHWLGRTCFHAGAVVVDGRAWAIVGDRDSGKSSLLAWLARLGYRVACDDLLVVDGRTVFAGPRAVDLREDPGEELEGGTALGLVGGRERWRYPLAPVPAETTLAGWIFLRWGDELDVRRVPVVSRPVRLRLALTLQFRDTQPPQLLDLASLPCWELSRPRAWGSIEDSARCVVELAMDGGAR